MGRLVSSVVDQTSRRTSSTYIPQFTVSPASVHDLNVDVPDTEKPPTTQGDDNYAERIAKYVPAEVVTFFLAADKLFDYVQNDVDCSKVTSIDCMINGKPELMPLIVFVIGVILTPIYIRQQRTAGQPWGAHAVMATIAFVVWTYAVHASVFNYHGLYSGRMAALIVLIFTAVSGFVVPTKPKV